MGELSGVLILDKPGAMTSHDAVNIMRRLYDTKRVGHTGTLDPMATGVLVILIGRAAKAAEYLVSDSKRYRAGLRLGITTDTADTSGSVIAESADIPESESVMAAVDSFVGKIEQIPPMYSAIKVKGRKLVDLARRGITVERKPREVMISSIECHMTSKTEYILDVVCSKGTYIRTLCEDIGAKLGCGAVMSSLRRTASGSFDIKNSHRIDELETMNVEGRTNCLLPIESLFYELDNVELDGFFAGLAHSGQEIYQKKIKTDFALGQRVRMSDENGFFALGEVRDFEKGSAIKAIKQFVL